MADMNDDDIIIPEVLGGCKLLHRNDKCHACSSKPNPDTADKPLMKCGVCKWALYCNPSCQKVHWKIHKKECKALIKPKEELRRSAGVRFDHVREMIECIRRVGMKYIVKDLCVSEMQSRETGKTLYWMFEEPMDNPGWENGCWSCTRDR